MGTKGSEPHHIKTGFLFPLEALLGILGQAKTFLGRNLILQLFVRLSTASIEGPWSPISFSVILTVVFRLSGQRISFIMPRTEWGGSI